MARDCAEERSSRYKAKRERERRGRGKGHDGVFVDVWAVECSVNDEGGRERETQDRRLQGGSSRAGERDERRRRTKRGDGHGTC